jgi:hypothetical protein
MIGSGDFRHRQLPDLFSRGLSAPAGPTVGICRTFFAHRHGSVGLWKRNASSCPFAYKAITKHRSVNKEGIAGLRAEARLLLKN